MQDQGDIQGAFRRVRRCIAIQHEEEVRSMRQVAVRLNYVLALANAVVSGHDHGNLRSQPDRLVHIGIMIVLLKFRIIEGKRGHGGPQYIHGKGVFGGDTQQIENGVVEFALFREAFPDFLQFVTLRQAAEPEQEAGFFKIRVVGEVMNIDTTICQNSLFAVDVTDAGGGGNNALKTLGRVRGGYAGHTPSQELQMVSVAGPRGIGTRVRNPLLYAKMGPLSKRERYIWVGCRAYT